MRKIFRQILRRFRDPRAASFLLYRTFLKALGLRRPVLRKLACANASIFIDPTDAGISRDLFLHGIREENASWTIKRFLRPGQTIIDIGANIGYYVLIEADATAPSGRVYAIEPDPHNLDLLRKSVQYNGWASRVDIEWGGVSDHGGTAILHLATKSNLHTLNRTPSMKRYVEFKGEMEVPVFTLDEYVVRKGIDPAKIDLIRMDTEGHEAIAVKGMLKILAAARSLVMFI